MLHTIAKRFRRAIETADISKSSVGEEAYLRMNEFPKGACSEVTDIFGIYLRKKYSIDALSFVVAQIEVGTKWYGNHQWLEHNNIIIDITADQFSSLNNQPVIVTRKSHFHLSYAKKVYHHEFKLGLKDLPNWEVLLYRAVVSQITPDSDKTAATNRAKKKLKNEKPQRLL